MASLNTFFSPNSGGKPWVHQISKTLQSQLAVTIDTPPLSIFQIPKTIKSENLESYVPQRVGLGPNHHFQPELYHNMEQNKLTAVKRVLKTHQIHDFQHQIVEKVKDIVPVICAVYDVYLDADEDTLAWLFAIDGVFLLDQLDAYSDHQFTIEGSDLIMLENQIPLIVLKEIHKALSGENDVDYFESKFRFFGESYSPFLLSKEKINVNEVDHLLGCMYHSIVNNKTSISRKVNITNSEDVPSEKDAKQELLEAVIQFTRLIPRAEPFVQIIAEKNMTSEEIKVPSVSKLHEIAGVKFCLSPSDGGIRNISFVLEKERACYLPLLTLNLDSEVVLRNLVAYEQLMARYSIRGGFGLELTEYVDFICGIVDTAKDVRLLREKEIIKGELSDEEIVKLFNGIARSHRKMSVESKLSKTLAELNKVYESMPRVWIQKLVDKQLRTSAKVVTFIVSISSTLILIREVYSMVYGSSLNPPHMMLVGFVRSKWNQYHLIRNGCIWLRINYVLVICCLIVTISLIKLVTNSRL